jgi:succinate-semialdehyde dehydrogenase/glutarate-semialdehyde dehydrogenase
MVTRKLAPALAAGCTSVLKPAAETPLTALALVQLLEEAGLPSDAVNVVVTSDPGPVVTSWLADPRVRKLSFTGSTAVGRRLLRSAADRVLNTSMELGGNAPFVVMHDADVDAAVEGVMVAKFRNAGQACTAANRCYVHADVADHFVSRLTERVQELVLGPGGDGGVDIGPLISRAAVEKVDRLVGQAVAEGARAVVAGRRPDRGHFVEPTVITGLAPDSSILGEEIFGPVLPVVTWRTRDELLHMVNDTEYGLAAYVYSRDLAAALRLAEHIEAGMVAVNRGMLSDPSAPFGGVKESGLGREGARDGIDAFTEVQYFSVAWPD